jgi:nitroreductase
MLLVMRTIPGSGLSPWAGLIAERIGFRAVDVFTAISTARAIRRFDVRSLEQEHLDRILEAGRLSPSSNNEQPWTFIVCTDRQQLGRLSHIGDWASYLADAAAAIAIVVPNVEEGSQRDLIAFDSGQCARTMMLAAWELGVGSCHVAVYDHALTQSLLGYPNEMSCDVLLSLGYPADPELLTRPIARSARRPLSEIVHLERW